MAKTCCGDLQTTNSPTTLGKETKGEPEMHAPVDATYRSGPIVPTETKTATELIGMAEVLLGWRANHDALGPNQEAVRRFILTQYPLLGRAPSCQEIAAALELSPSEVRTTLERLHELDFLNLEPGAREIRLAYPFSTVPTRHVVKFPDWVEAKPVYAQCAVDALGIPFMFRGDLSIASSCAHCKKPIEIEVRDRKITAYLPAETVVWSGTVTMYRDCVADICPSVNFFCSPAHVSAWQVGQKEANGSILSLGEALYLGKGIFENHLYAQPSTMSSATTTLHSPRPENSVMTASAAWGLVTAFLASVCCVGPLVFAALGVGVGATGFLAGTASFLKALLPYRPLFIGLTGLLVGVAFYLTYRSPRAACTTNATCASGSGNRMNRTLLWIVTAIALALVLAPYWLGI